MRRLLRILFNTITVLSLVLAIVVALLWAHFGALSADATGSVVILQVHKVPWAWPEMPYRRLRVVRGEFTYALAANDDTTALSQSFAKSLMLCVRTLNSSS